VQRYMHWTTRPDETDVEIGLVVVVADAVVAEADVVLNADTVLSQGGCILSIL